MDIFTKTQKEAKQAEKNRQAQINSYLSKNPTVKPGGKKDQSLSLRVEEAIENSTLHGTRTFRDPVLPHNGMVTSYGSTLLILFQGIKMKGKELPIAPTQLNETLKHYGLVSKKQVHGGAFYITMKGKDYIKGWLPIIVDTIIHHGTEKDFLEKDKLKNHPLIKKHVIPFLNELIEARKEEIAETQEKLKLKGTKKETLTTYQVVMVHSPGVETIIHKPLKEKAIALEIYENWIKGGNKGSFELV